MPPHCYLESVFAVYVVIGLNWCNDITGKRDATEDCLLSAVCVGNTHNTQSAVTEIQNNGVKSAQKRSLNSRKVSET